MTDDALPIDLEVARRFIATLTGSADTAVTWQTFDDNHARRDKSLAVIKAMPLPVVGRWLCDINGQGAGIYITINVTKGAGRSSGDVTALRALFVDIDGTRGLPPSWPLAPSIIVQRGPQHWHAYWLLHPGEALSDFTPAQVQLAGYWTGDLQVADLPRVMRVPGFLHRKAEPLAVFLVEADATRRYTIDQVLALHPVDWSSLHERYQLKAQRVGIWSTSAPSVPAPAATSTAADVGTPEWQVEQFVKWAEKKDTTAGDANPHGGRNTAAFVIACEGHGRELPQGVIEDVVTDYLRRASYPNPETTAKRVVSSAMRAPKQGHAPVRRAPAGSGRGGDGAARPPTPPAGGAPPSPPSGEGSPAPTPPSPPEYAGLDLKRLENTWAISERGVAPLAWDAKADGMKVKYDRRVADLPIWPDCPGRDVATGRAWWRLAWKTPAGLMRRQWIEEGAMKFGKDLVQLADGPIVDLRCGMAAFWLTAARSAVTAPEVDVVSRIGWCGINGGRRWVWPGVGADKAVQFVGEALPAHGTLEGWCAGLRHLVELKEKGFVALAVAAFSAAAPFARLLNGQRNPVLGLQARSSSGKGSVIDWALALWCEPASLRLPASSTAKGVQDRAIQLPDLPVFLDELQQLAEQDQRVASDALYFLANGQRRVTSSKTQTSVGGEARHGVGFYAAEAPVLPGLNVGVNLRVVELTGDPCPDEATARVLRQAGQHTGVLASAIAELIQAHPVVQWMDWLRERAAALKKLHPKLEAGDADALTLMERGCGILEACIDIELPTDQLVAWLAQRIEEQRKATVDRETLALQQVLSVILNLPWWQMSESGSQILRKGVVVIQQRPIAWRSWGPQGETTALSCDPQHPHLQGLFQLYGGEQRVLRAWIDRGWAQRGEGRNLKVKRWGGGRVAAFTAEVLAREIDPDIPPHEPAPADAKAPAREPAPADAEAPDG